MSGARRRAALAGLALALAAPSAAAAVYRVGPHGDYDEVADVASRLEPGDVVEVEGGYKYDAFELGRSGAPGRPITVRGLRRGGRRPTLVGGRAGLTVSADHVVVEGFEVTGGQARCVLHEGHDVTLRDLVVHGCPTHGILSSDSNSGSLTLEYVEVYDSGRGEGKHQIYVATDETRHPGSVFRMRHCYVHDGNGGNNVKSRAERNEIYYNWVEGAFYHEIELIGPDGQDPSLAREDSDVVGNVVRKLNDAYVFRVGGDATGETAGRYRFAYNTIVVASDKRAVFRAFDRLESVEAHDNVIYRAGGGGVRVLIDEDARWVRGARAFAGSRNWLPEGSREVPAGWADTLTGADPGFANPAAFDLRPRPGSPLVDAAGPAETPAALAALAFPAPLAEPAMMPPARALGPAAPRPRLGQTLDVGALEAGAERPRAGDAEPLGWRPSGTPWPAGSGRGLRASCRCQAAGGPGGGAPAAFALAALAIGLARRGAGRASRRGGRAR
ncbi:MAG TPA: right-handed parallel beta-helix repeat-containing protein [Polyangiaceae bacterium]|nr:right-handed parallel beta-helix repeat-containing protein [Polyangiaceae bacterium]